MERPIKVTMMSMANIVIFLVFASLFGYMCSVDPVSAQVWTISFPFLGFVALPLYATFAFLIFATVASILFLKGLKWTWYFFFAFWVIALGFAIPFALLLLFFIPPLFFVAVAPIIFLYVLFKEDVREYFGIAGRIERIMKWGLPDSRDKELEEQETNAPETLSPPFPNIKCSNGDINEKQE